MILFGWGKTTIRNFGPCFKKVCGNCNNEEYWNMSRIMTWFTLFFIPVFPYEIKYFLSCPICQYGVKLNRTQVSEIKPLAIANKSLIEGKITEQEYHQLLNANNKKALAENRDNQKEISGEIKDEDLRFCTECGCKIVSEIKYCAECGTKVVR